MELKIVYKALVKSNYRAYCYFVHEGRWIPGKAASYICDTVQEFIERPTTAAYEILIVEMPPQHGKSMSITETLPSWYLMKNPLKRVIEISYSEDFAQLFGRRNRNKIEQFGDVFGIKLAKEPNSVTEFELENKIGGMISRGITSGVTGRPGDLMIIDDPVKNRQEADSEVYRRRVYEEWIDAFRSRLSAGAKVILIMTRWHEDDLAGRLIATEKHVTVLRLPCEAEEDDPLGRKVGDALCPEIGKDNKWLEEFKGSHVTKEGARSWNALYQQRPTSELGNLIKRGWWKYYAELPKIATMIMSIDATFKDNRDDDFVSIQVWGKTGADIYLIDLIKRQMNFPDTLKAIRVMCARYPECLVKLIEDKANGPAIISVLQHEIPGIIAVDPKGGKIARVNAVSGAIESGNVYLPRYAAFTIDFVDECATFPNGAHDDQVDAMSQALNRFIYYPASLSKDQTPIKLKDKLKPTKKGGYL